jgi:hypothetical protein
VNNNPLNGYSPLLSIAKPSGHHHVKAPPLFTLGRLLSLKFTVLDLDPSQQLASITLSPLQNQIQSTKIVVLEINNSITQNNSGGS